MRGWERVVKNTDAAIDKIKRCQNIVSKLRTDLFEAQDKERSARYEYGELIRERVKQLLIESKCAWKWPTGRSGRREAKLTLKHTSELVNLVKWLRDADNRRMNIRFDVVGDATVTFAANYYDSDWTATVGLKAAKAIGIVNPAKKQDKNKLFAELEKAGITDPDKLAELLRSKTSE